MTEPNWNTINTQMRDAMSSFLTFQFPQMHTDDISLIASYSGSLAEAVSRNEVEGEPETPATVGNADDVIERNPELRTPRLPSLEAARAAQEAAQATEGVDDEGPSSEPPDFVSGWSGQIGTEGEIPETAPAPDDPGNRDGTANEIPPEGGSTIETTGDQTTEPETPANTNETQPGGGNR